MIHAAAVDLVRRGILADRQSVYKPLLKIVLVLSQYRFHGIVQKLQVLFQLGEVASGDGGISLFLYAEAIFAPVEVVVLAEVFGVCEVGERLLILAGIISFIQLLPLAFPHRPSEALVFQPFNGGL